MIRLGCGVSRGSLQSILGLVAAVAVFTVTADSADARRYHRHAFHGGSNISHHFSRDTGYSPPYSAIVVDANTGRTLHESSPDGLRHPASLTKIMTLYLLFERLDSGKMKLSTAMPVSEHAASQSPTKLGLRPGQNIVVEDAIRGLVTRSANDAAVVIAEAIGGDEDEFARMMTAKAHALGMARTTYRNASGLPDDDQVTTARDQALLGRVIQERFPRYYTYFSTPSFTYRGETIRNHNHLLGQMEGVDGIKTGYTNASGFNLVTSIRRDNRHVVAVVMGGSSAGARDARMRELLQEHLAEASTRRTATMVADAGPDPVMPSAPAEQRTPVQAAAPSRGYALATMSSVAAPPPTSAAPVQGPIMVSPKAQAPGNSSEPLKPIAVKTIKVKLATVHTASLAPAAVMIPVADETGSTPPAPKVVAALSPPAAPSRGLQPSLRQDAAQAQWPSIASLASEPVAAPAPPAPKPEPSAAPARSPQVHSGWIIQIGAFGTEDEAKQHLDAAQSKVRNVLGRANAFTEPVTKGDKTFYRARFAGLDKSQAEATCKQLKHSDIACMTVKN